MKFNFKSIKVLLLRYVDNVCCEENSSIVKQHLIECAKCNEPYEYLINQDVNNKDDKVENFPHKEIIKKHNYNIKSSTAYTTIFIILIILYWFVWALKAYAWIKFQENITTILSVISMSILFFMTAIGVLITKEFAKHRNTGNKTKIISVFLTFILVINIVMMVSFNELGYTVSTLSSITTKNFDGDKFYFSILEIGTGKKIDIECSEQIYNEIVADKNIYYSMTYRKLNFIKNKGYLGEIDTIRIINNKK